VDDAELLRRGEATLVGSWEVIARGADGAAVRRLPGAVAAVFPCGPEREVYNNALLTSADALDAVEAAYATVDRYAVWVHERGESLRGVLERRGYRLDTATRAMGAVLAELQLTEGAAEPAAWADYVRFLGRDGVPPGLLADVDPGAFELAVARLDGELVAAAIGFDRDGDRGIYNLSTAEHARRRGIGRALTERLLRGATGMTASLQSTEMAERLYAAIGFRDLGRYFEYVPRG
jgi:ribosomal protein S18 acetylase RimI-like enzyme